jgi:integrase
MLNKFIDIVTQEPRHKTAAIPGTITSVPGYPTKLKVYLNNASPYWQASYYDQGTTYRHSCKTRDKREAYKRAIEFYEMLILKKYQHPYHLKDHDFMVTLDRPPNITEHLQFQSIIDEWLKRKGPLWTPRHKIEVERRLKNNVIPAIGKRNIQKITTAEVLAIIKKVEERGAFDLAKRVLNDCSQIWRFAMASGFCKRNITDGLSVVLLPHSVTPQKAVPLEKLPQLMRDIEQYSKPNEDNVRLGLKLLAMTFVRKSELLYAKWAEFDLNAKLWKIPAERMKMRVEHTVPLSTRALSVLKELQEKFPSDEYLFHNGDSSKPIRDNALIEALYWMGYKNQMTAHGFRAIASTVLNEREFRADVIERQLAHIDGNQVRRAYNRAEYMEERMEMMAWWSDYLYEISQ